MARLGLTKPGTPDRRVCDFCELPYDQAPPVCAYPVKPFELNIGGGVPIVIDMPVMTDAWRACETCAAFIDAGDYAGLALHMGYAPHPLGVLPHTVAQFRDARIGPAQPLAQD